jgi:hypothetical protein
MHINSAKIPVNRGKEVVAVKGLLGDLKQAMVHACADRQGFDQPNCNSRVGDYKLFKLGCIEHQAPGFAMGRKRGGSGLTCQGSILSEKRTLPAYFEYWKVASLHFDCT